MNFFSQCDHIPGQSIAVLMIITMSALETVPVVADVLYTHCFRKSKQQQWNYYYCNFHRTDEKPEAEDVKELRHLPCM